MADKLTGKASYITINGTTLCITKYSAKVTRTLADTTDSCDYNSNIDLLQTSQLPVQIGQEISVEGYYRLSQTTAALASLCFTGITAVPVVLGLNAGALYGSGLFDMSDFGVEVPVNDTVKFTATLRSNGFFNVGA